MAKAFAARVKIKDRDRGWKRLLRKLRKSPPDLTVGVHGEQDARNGGGIGNVGLAAVHEFGSARARIPERSFLRRTIDEKQSTYLRMSYRLGAKVYAEKSFTLRDGLEILGAKVASDVRRTIRLTPGDWPALKPATIRRKGSSKPLVDRAELIRSIKHKVTG